MMMWRRALPQSPKPPNESPQPTPVIKLVELVFGKLGQACDLCDSQSTLTIRLTMLPVSFLFPLFSLRFNLVVSCAVEIAESRA